MLAFLLSSCTTYRGDKFSPVSELGNLHTTISRCVIICSDANEISRSLSHRREDILCYPCSDKSEMTGHLEPDFDFRLRATNFFR